MGNVLFLSGVTLVIGAPRAVRFFFQRKRARGSALFFSGIAMVLVGYAKIGIVIEAFGFVNLFGYGSFPPPPPYFQPAASWPRVMSSGVADHNLICVLFTATSSPLRSLSCGECL
mmetsp:Transcript_6500/g.13011  ORF Transcript_6500/g.13011 Transcript_6500/m.13011 type:complete len:115 (-) Transcript_6500:1290-1634(-)